MQEPAEPRSTTDRTVRTWWREPVRRNEPIVQALVIPFLVVMRDERRELITQYTLEDIEHNKRTAHGVWIV